MWMGDQEDVTRDYPDNDEMSLGDAGTKSPPPSFFKTAGLFRVFAN